MKDQTKVLSLKSFLKLNRQEISEVVADLRKPKCVAIMLDGTRRLLKLDPKFHDDSWLYYEDYIKGLIFKSIEVADILFDMGVETVIGPLASFGNLHRTNFMPDGLENLLQPLLDSYPISVLEKHNASISLYGDLDFARSMNGGKIVDDYIDKFKKISHLNSKKRILLGIGFSTDRETLLISNLAVDFFRKNKRNPTEDELIKEYFGFEVDPIDLFIRTNEIRPSGGLTPLLTGHDTQFYFPVSPGIISLKEEAIKKIFYDYLYSRVLSHGMHEHKPITSKQAKIVKDFYFKNVDQIIGIGTRIADMWISRPQKN